MDQYVQVSSLWTENNSNLKNHQFSFHGMLRWTASLFFDSPGTGQARRRADKNIVRTSRGMLC